MTQTLRLTSAEQLISFLGAEPAALRLKTVRAIQDHPERVAAYGAEPAAEIVAALWGRLRLEVEGTIRAEVLDALGRLPLEAVRQHCIDSLSGPHQELALEAATILTRQRATGLSADVQLRVWLLTENAVALSATLVQAHVTAWLAELAGANRPLACRLLGRFGARALALLAPHRAQLEPEAHAWLVSLVEADSLEPHVELLDDALSHDDTTVLIAAVTACAAVHDRLPEPLRHRLEQLREHPDPEVRIACCSVPADATRLIADYREEPDGRVRAALLRIVPTSDPAALELLSSALQGERWRERAVAIDAFVRMGVSAVPHLRQLVRGAAHGNLVPGAWQALSRLGDDAWLESAFNDWPAVGATRP
jgi:hypothetical protein